MTLTDIFTYFEGLRGLWMVEWNEEQQAFHLESVDTRLRRNLEDFWDHRNQGEWITIGIFNTRVEAQDFIDAVRVRKPKHLAKYEML